MGSIEDYDVISYRGIIDAYIAVCSYGNDK